ncbi:hypothetical protein [Jiella marina]|uniref:hypothetical protein n=1 Tax=Jiella sp. LLJ827 TaxID=2917712 RepID=UPI002101134B|nr:hypothetical protein [Jiella sp. LLJ827]MCQ0988843.1 hypothetical protein [Jiella sp. LLJ827]
MPSSSLRLVSALAVALAVLSPVTSSAADDAVNVMQYALSHPTDNAQLPSPPALGDSVPRSVQLATAEGNGRFAYFYYAGAPVIVDLKTRSIVRIGG